MHAHACALVRTNLQEVLNSLYYTGFLRSCNNTVQTDLRTHKLQVGKLIHLRPNIIL